MSYKPLTSLNQDLIFKKQTNRSLFVDASTTTSSVGADITVKSAIGGPGTGGAASGNGGTVYLQGGAAGTNNGGGGGSGGEVKVIGGTSTGSPGYGGAVYMDGGSGGSGYGNTLIATVSGPISMGKIGSTISILSDAIYLAGDADHGMLVLASSPDTVGGYFNLNGGQGGVASTTAGGRGGDIIVQGGTGGAGTATKVAGAGADAFIRGGIAGINNGFGSGIGGKVSLEGGYGADGYSSSAATSGGLIQLVGGVGGHGTASVSSAVGGNITITAGIAGNNNGGGGNNGGNVTIDGGSKTGAGTNGIINIGVTSASLITISRSGITTSIDGYLKVSSQATLSSDGSDTLRLTQAANTTTGANLRLRQLKFFTDNVPTTQMTGGIYAGSGSQIVISAPNDILIDAPIIDWAQNASVYTGGFNLKLGASTNNLQIYSGITNTVPGFDFVATGTGASSGNNFVNKLVMTANYVANGVNTVDAYINNINNTNDAYTGSTTGLHIDISSGTNTSFNKISLKQKAHPAYSGSEYITTTASAQSTSTTPVTAYTLALADNTTYVIQVIGVGRDEAGANHAALGRVTCMYRESAGAATQESTTQTMWTDIHTNPAQDVQINTSGNNVIIQVKSQAATTIDWALTIKYQAVSLTT